MFDPTFSDFSPLARDANGIFLGKSQHAARVMINEEGCAGAAYSAMVAGGAEYPPDEIDFVLDRPFLFVITGVDGLPLFAGVVNQPV